MKKILFDLDGTVYDLLAGVEKEIPNFSGDLLESYNFANAPGLSDEDVSDIYKLFNDPIFFYRLKPYEPVVRATEYLKRKYQVHFYTSCNNEYVYNAKKKAMERDFPIFGENLVLYRFEDMSINQLNEYDVIVDDYLDKMKALETLLKNVYFLVSTHNYNFPYPRPRYSGQVDPKYHDYKDEFLFQLERGGVT